jgi:hypothetical protein
MTRKVPDRVLAAARAARAPEALTEAARRKRFGPVAELPIEPGQLWRARTASVVMFLLLLDGLDDEAEPDRRRILAAPTTVDPPGEDDRSLVLNETANVFGVEVTVWAGLAKPVPIHVLEDILDQVPGGIVEYCRTLTMGEEPLAALPAQSRRGHPIRSAFAPSAEVRSDVEDEWSTLVESAGLPVANAAIPGELARPKLPLRLAQVMQALGLPQPAAMQLLRGKYPLTPEQAQQLAEVAGLSESDVLDTVHPLPAGVVSAVEHPRARMRLLQLASRTGRSEEQTRRGAAYAVYALAARETGGAGAWRQRLDRWLDSKLASGPHDERRL